MIIIIVNEVHSFAGWHHEGSFVWRKRKKERRRRSGPSVKSERGESPAFACSLTWREVTTNFKKVTKRRQQRIQRMAEKIRVAETSAGRKTRPLKKRTTKETTTKKKKKTRGMSPSKRLLKMAVEKIKEKKKKFKGWGVKKKSRGL